MSRFKSHIADFEARKEDKFSSFLAAYPKSTVDGHRAYRNWLRKQNNVSVFPPELIREAREYAAENTIKRGPLAGTNNDLEEAKRRARGGYR